MSFRHGGEVRGLARLAGCAVEELLDFSANINPLGPPDCLRTVTSRYLGDVTRYPDPYCQELRQAIATASSVPVNRVVCGNGSTELLYALPRALRATRAVIPVPSYIDYAAAATAHGLPVVYVPQTPESGFTIDWSRLEPELSGGDVVFIGQPGNPSGVLYDSLLLEEVADRHPDTYFVIDEAFADFVTGYRSPAVSGPPNIVTLRSMTKFYAIPGLRLGYAIAREPIVARFSEVLPPWSVGGLAQAVGRAVLEDQPYAEKTRREVPRLRSELQNAMLSLGGLEVFPSSANYLLVRLDREGMDAQRLARELLAERIAIRTCDNYRGLDGRYFRVAVRPTDENDKFLEAVGSILGSKTGRRRRSTARRVPAIMFQGTASNAGKSVLTAAFCRILLQDGYRVAPFKTQNMSLNSYVTHDGKEMGRAQVVQAQAARLDPDVRMNPVLLKPNSETGSQVIVMGEPVGNMDVGEYISYKPEALAAAKGAYSSLASEVDVMVIEGAGSPGEVNLKNHDITNMATADFARAPVLLVGDIDRGGVFASFVGTLEVLSERERAVVAGFLINRFRGDIALLDGATTYLRRRTGLPTLGTVPYIDNLGLPEEDSVSFKARTQSAATPGPDQIEIVVVDLPHIANFTDFDPLDLEPDVCLRIIRDVGQVDSPDAVIIPGSKNVPGDLAYLRQSGLADKITELVRSGIPTVGICGGLQMLGINIEDPHGVESSRVHHRGLGLLPLDTVLAPQKTLKAVTARHLESGLTLKGYEIHHGRTDGAGARPAIVAPDGEAIGFATDDGVVMGTYLHGLFDDDLFRRWYIDRLRVQKGLAAVGEVAVAYDLEPALDRLADIVRANVDVGQVYALMGLE